MTAPDVVEQLREASRLHWGATSDVKVRAADTIELLAEIADDLFEFAVDASCQGTGTGGPFGDDPLWHMHMSTWEWAAHNLPRIRQVLIDLGVQTKC